jgi:hypothetical protein
MVGKLSARPMASGGRENRHSTRRRRKAAAAGFPFIPVHPMVLLIGEYLEAGKHGGAVSHETHHLQSCCPRTAQSTAWEPALWGKHGTRSLSGARLSKTESTGRLQAEADISKSG